jgi:uncharacterized protein (TIGR03083 family)
VPEGPRREIEALAAEGAKVSAFLRGLDDAGWKAPTRCPPWDVREIVIHMTTMMRVMGETAEKPSVSEEPGKDRASWWDYDIEEDKAESLTFMEEQTTRFPAGGIDEEWRSALERGVAAVRSALATGDPVVRPWDSAILLSEYVATRVLEITIHQMDVRDAFGLPPDPSPEGLAITLDILRRRLGGDPIEMGFKGVDFILLATGRRELDDHDRARLGMPATRLPLLA